MYIVQLSDKYEKLLKEMCWNDAYLILGLEYQYMVNQKKFNPHLHSGNEYWYGGYTHIVATTSSDDVAKI